MYESFDFEYPNVWDSLKNSKQPIVLYGMGNGADKVLDNLENLGVTPAGVMASDAFVRYQSFRGFTVKKLADFEKELGEFTVALCFGSSLPSVMDDIRAVAEKHETLIPAVPVIGNEIVDDGFIRRNSGRIKAAYALLADDISRRVFKGVLDFYYTGRLGYLDAVTSDKAEAFSSILRLCDESYLDLGAYRGDTVDEFLSFTDGYADITAVEPNPNNYRKLCERIASIANAVAVNCAIADREGVMKITKGGGRMATLSSTEGVEVPVHTVDGLGLSPTYIKADVEGMESATLSGAIETLKRRPKLNIAAYHRLTDLFELVIQLHELAPEYDIHLRRHPYIPCWDLNIYAV